MRSAIGVCAMVFLSGCGGDSTGSDPTGSDPNFQRPTILGPQAEEYSEVKEVENSDRDTPEDTGYEQTADGIAILGIVEAGELGQDYYLFQTGSFDRIDVQVSGQGSELIGFALSLDAFADDGLSVLTAQSGRFQNAFVTPGSTYVLKVSSGGTTSDFAGGLYRLEMKGNP